MIHWWELAKSLPTQYQTSLYHIHTYTPTHTPSHIHNTIHPYTIMYIYKTKMELKLFSTSCIFNHLTNFNSFEKHCCTHVLRSSKSVGSREHWLWDIARKRNAFLMFSTVLRILQLLITLSQWSDSGGVFSKMYLSKINPISLKLQSNRKLKISHVQFRLISLHSITNIDNLLHHFLSETPAHDHMN